jgi:hypothetical protein
MVRPREGDGGAVRPSVVVSGSRHAGYRAVAIGKSLQLDIFRPA